jgi:hypothetical protein
MLCQKCKKQEALVHLTIVKPGSKQMTKRNLCESCYNESDISKKIATSGWTSCEPSKTIYPDNDLKGVLLRSAPGWSAEISSDEPAHGASKYTL